MSRLIGLVLVFALSGCSFTMRAGASLYTRPTGAVFTTDCPELEATEENHGARPSEASIWVAGHWRFGSGWVWVLGTWIVARAGHVWEPPVCVAGDRGTQEFHPGYFRPELQAPPRIYREPGHIRMSIPSDQEPADVPLRVLPGIRGDVALGTVTVPSAGTGVPDPTPVPPTSGPPVDGPAVDVPTVPGGTGTVDIPGETLPETPNVGTEPPPLQCSVLLSRVPSGGYVTLRGSGFTDDVEVRIGGTVAGIRRRSATELVVHAAAGVVRVIRGDEDVTCGNVSIIRR